MPSPFPGMDPWLERPTLFPGLHSALINYTRAALAARLPKGYVVNADARVWMDDELRRTPDVNVYGPDEPPRNGNPGGRTALFAAVGMVAVAARPMSDPHEEFYLEILAGDGERLVTAIEIVSPANKEPGRGRISYQQKQEEFQAGGVGLVEIDLLRAGPHTTAVPERAFRRAAGACDYHACVTTWEVDRLQHYVAPIRLADPLPTILAPLDPGVDPVPVDLQAVFTRAYDELGYAELVKYARPCDPPLSPEQAAWAADILARRSR